MLLTLQIFMSLIGYQVTQSEVRGRQLGSWVNDPLLNKERSAVIIVIFLFLKEISSFDRAHTARERWGG